MNNFRLWGKEPYSTIVVHGGPGMPGDCAPLAQALSDQNGVLEVLQTKSTIEGLIEELRSLIIEQGQSPVVLIGHSWGAMLSFMFAAQYPTLVSKLILIGSGEFEEKYATGIMDTRLSRLDDVERNELLTLLEQIGDPKITNKDELFRQIGPFIHKTDSYEETGETNEYSEFSAEQYDSVWSEAELLRASGKMLEMGRKITCPVVVIHGDHDPHPFEGIKSSLSGVVKDVTFHNLEKCGHYPWFEMHAKERFFMILRKALSKSISE